MKVAKMLRSSRFLQACVFTMAGLLMSGCGDNGTEETEAVVPPTPVVPVPASPTMALFAGNVDGYGNVDGPATIDSAGLVARFGNPGYVAIDSSGNFYVADTYNNTIRKITAAGVVTTLAGTAGVTGSTDATGAAASFNEPQGIAIDSAGNVYVADSLNNRIRKITPDGVVTTFAGSGAGFPSTDGQGILARLDTPYGLAIDGSGNLYVAEQDGGSIRKITDGFVSTLEPDGFFDSPRGIAVDNGGNVYVANTEGNNIWVIPAVGAKFLLAGNSGGAGGSVDNVDGLSARFDGPAGLVFDGGILYVSDRFNDTVRTVDTNTTAVTTLAGGVEGYTDGVGTLARFDGPSGVAIDGGNLFVVDSDNSTIRKIVIGTQVVTTLAGAPGQYGYLNATGAAARFDYPGGLATDSAGNVYVSSNSVIRKATPGGEVSTLAGTVDTCPDGIDTSPSASFCYPEGIATDSAGNVYVADTYNNAIRKVTSTGLVTTLAGIVGAECGVADGTGTSASFCFPSGVATDSAGNLYVADTSNSTIRKIVISTGVVTTLAGAAGQTGSTNDIGSAARFTYPIGIVTDSSGNIYVTDSPDPNGEGGGPGNYTIRKITAEGVVSTLAGTAGVTGSTDATGAAARFGYPFGIASDSAGNLYVADYDNYTIRKILISTGAVTTLAGTAGQNGFTPGALPGVLSNPKGIAVFGTTLYFGSNDGVVSITNLP